MANKPSIDGFIPRRSTGIIGERHNEDKKLQHSGAVGLQRHQPLTPTGRPAPNTTNALKPTDTALTRRQDIISRPDIDESLREIDSVPTRDKKPPKRGGWRKNKRKIIKRVVIVIVLIGLILGGWLAVKAFLAGRDVFKGDIFGLVQQKDLKMDANGRTNVLVVGTSEDDPGHPGATLTDSIMIISIDQKKNNAFMISIPRDLEVKYGRACNSGYAGKINEYFSCINDDWESSSAEDERQTESREFFGGIVGLDLQYSAHVNYSVMRDVVAAIGGITVVIDSPDERGQMDGNFDWKCGDTYSKRLNNCPPRGHFIDYPNGPVNLDAEHALYLAQARGDTDVSWGFPNSNFEREKNQQKIVVAIKEKAMSTGTLTNVGKVTGIIDALGKNLRTNFDTSEIRTLMKLAQDIPAKDIQSISLIDNELVKGNAQPTAGLYNFSQIQAFIKKKLNSSPVAREGAHVIVLNASGVGGVAQSEADRLTTLGMEVDQIGNAPTSGTFTKNTIYQITTDKPLSAAKLNSIYTTTAVTTAPPVTVGDDTDFVIIVVTPIATTSSTATAR